MKGWLVGVVAVEAVGERNGRYPDVRRTTRIAHQAAVALVARIMAP